MAFPSDKFPGKPENPAPTIITINNTVDMTFPEIAPGVLMGIWYDAILTTIVEPNELITNTANLTYTSLPGSNGTNPNPTGSTTPGASGWATGERNGSGAPLNDYFDADQASVRAIRPTATKSVVTTSEGHTAGTDLAIGEIVRYRLDTVIPEGTSPSLVITDTLPLGMMFIDLSEVRISFVADANMTELPILAGADNDASPPTFVLPAGLISTVGQDVNFNLGTLINNDINDGNTERVIIEFNALVENVAGNNHNDTKTNSYTVDVSAVTLATSNPVTVTIVEPEISDLAKVALLPLPADAGDTVAYRVTYSNTSTVDAFDVRLTDSLPALELALDLGSVAVTLGGGAATSGHHGDLRRQWRSRQHVAMDPCRRGDDR